MGWTQRKSPIALLLNRTRGQHLQVILSRIMNQRKEEKALLQIWRKKKTSQNKAKVNRGLELILVQRIPEHSFGILLMNQLSLCEAKLERLQCLQKWPSSPLEISLLVKRPDCTRPLSVMPKSSLWDPLRERKCKNWSARLLRKFWRTVTVELSLASRELI